ncbi:hypothetical protein [Marinimicrobium sp. ABcell2]|uniref:hypothetical protein n=1 Tax=Marinimicrobium sp. ABcell2 TaxID=3069751 RepID=UPI0027B4309D|nr:hypothetical protein [Marinimicrobium sp. ABcell2]MDQ2075291.1 hypothetical protein [Marinimicrobium sp. ABcell2]
MQPSSFDGWEINLAEGRALHRTGFSLQVEGDPKDPSAVAPGNPPNHLSVAEQASLLREGMAALAAASGPAVRSGPRVKSRAQQEAEAQAKLFAERSDKPTRPRLSLKKSS